MNIVLMTPPVSLSSSYGALKDYSNPQPSIGLAYIASVLVENGYNVSIIDGYLQQLSTSDILSKIGEQNADLIGISLLTTSADVIEELVQDIRKKFPDIIIVLGNIHASIFCDELLLARTGDYVVHREGEYSLLELVQAIESEKPCDAVKGISFLKDGKVIHTAERELNEELDSLPFPLWDIFPLDEYKTDSRTSVLENESEMQILSTRGCPNQCTFCSSRTDKSLGSKYRVRSPKNIVDELEYMHDRYNKKVFAFVDLAFPLRKKHAVEVFQEIIDRGLHKKIVWTTECRVKPIDYETLVMMKKAGCIRINFGIESGTNRILKMLKKQFTVYDVESAVTLAQKAGIEVDGMFMIGLPTETEEDIHKTVDFAIKLNLRYAIFNLFVPYPGCELYNMLTKSNKIRFKQWSDFTSYPTYSGRRPVYIPGGFTHGKMMALQQAAMKKYYLRPRFIWGEVKRFKFKNIPMYFKGLLGLFSNFIEK